MRDIAVTASSPARETIEDQLYEGLADVFALPAADSVEVSELVAGQIASHLADTARLSSDATQSRQALDALEDLEGFVRQLLRDVSASMRRREPDAERSPGMDATWPRVPSNVISLRPDLPDGGHA